MRYNTNIDLKNRRTFNFKDFTGVDLSSSPMNVATHRGSSMRNLISRDGANHKRHGWEQVLSQFATGDIYGIHAYNDEKIIIHYSNKLAYYKLIDGLWTYQSDITVAGYKSSSVFFNNKLVIFGCGSSSFGLKGIYTFNGNSISAVNPYVPTTTININYEGYVGDVTSTYEKTNRLTRRRKNTLVGVNCSGTGNDKTWALDYRMPLNASLPQISFINQSNQKKTLYCHNAKIYLEETHTTQIGEYDIGSNVTQSPATVTFNYDLTPPQSEMANITVEFDADISENTLSDCRFGCLFGEDGSNDRIFLSGNASNSNTVFWSEPHNEAYFPDTNTVQVGTLGKPIKSFLRLSDSTLAVLKDGMESNIYYLTSRKETFEGDLVPTTYFPAKAGTSGVYAVSPFTARNFGDDDVVLTNKGLCGIVLSDNIATTTRYAVERSLYINGELLKEDLTKAVGTVYEDKYFLSLGNGKVYVADRNQMFTPKNARSYNYEWYLLDNVPAAVWATVRGELWFGTEDGRVCRFNEGYVDRMFSTQSITAALGYIEDSLASRITVADSLQGDLLTPQKDDCIEGNDFYVYVATLKAQEIDGRYERYEFRVDGDSYGLHNGMKVYADSIVDGSNFNTDTEYVVRLNGDYVVLATSDGSFPDVNEGELLRISVKTDKLYLDEVDGSSNWTFKLHKGDDYNAILVKYNDVGFVPIGSATISRDSNVVAEWYSVVSDLGTNEASKTLEKMVIACEPNMSGHVEFGYKTMNGTVMRESQGQGHFSFENITFNNFTFMTGFANSFAIRCNERNFNYIMFKLKSDTSEDCAVNNFTIVYKLNKSNIGVR